MILSFSFIAAAAATAAETATATAATAAAADQHHMSVPRPVVVQRELLLLSRDRE